MSNNYTIRGAVHYSAIVSCAFRLACYYFDVISIPSALQTQIVSTDTEEYITAIDSTTFTSEVPHMSLQIPSELIRMFAYSSGGDGGEVRVISALYYNVEDLFPSGRPGINE